MPQYFKLAPNASMFWDEGQSVRENKKLIPGDVKPLEPTEAVMNAKRSNGILEVSESEYKEAVAAKEKITAASNEAAQARSAATTLSTAQPIYVIDSSSDISKQLTESLKAAQQKEASLAKMETEYQEKLAAIDQKAIEKQQTESAQSDAATKETPAQTKAKVKPDSPEAPRTQDQ